MSFVHLHNHTDYSFLDGATKVKDLARIAKQQGMPAVAITDHGNMCGAAEFFKAAKAEEIKPIIGAELYIVENSRFEKKRDEDKKRIPYYHLLLLAKNEIGWKNLIKLSSAGYLEGFYHKPRIDYDILEQHREGLICLSGCLQGHINQTFLKYGEEDALQIAGRYHDLFGEDFYLELQNHQIEEELECDRFLVDLSRKMNLPLVCTNDAHYATKEDADPHDILLCVQTRSFQTDTDRFKFHGDEFYLKPYEEMEALFGETPEALKNTLEIAEKVEFEMKFGEKHFPEYPLPVEVQHLNYDKYLRQLCEENLDKRYSEITDEILERLEYELGIIEQKQLASYFLIVRDFIAHAQKEDIPVGPGRGSAAGSLVSYLIGITNIDPIRYSLLFERFINPERESYPDIDVDFSDERRHEVIEYVRKKYGAENVTQIMTFGRMMSRGVVRDVGRVMQVPLPEVDAIAKLILDGPKDTLGKSLEEVKELQELVSSKPEYQEMIKKAVRLEGTIRNAGVHAAGVVITQEPLTDLVPLYKAPDGEVTTQFDMTNVEELGLLKVDFLGLKMLSILERAVNLVKAKGIDIDLDTIPIDDEKTYELFSHGDTIGIFQFESGGMRENLKKLKPERLEDLIAMNALYRPGPMENIGLFVDRKHGRKEIEYLHPMMQDILDETYGIIVYQEQVMQIANKLAGMSLGRADVLRRAMGKKKIKVMNQMMPEFTAGCAERGISEPIALKIWSLIEKFANYGFNKSHAAAYSLVAYQSGYLKAHYPAEFMAASMTTRAGHTEELILFLQETKKLGITVLPPDVNESMEEFTVTDSGEVRFGMTAIKNVGSAAIQAIIGERTVKENFPDLFALAATAVNNPLVNRKVLENLIKAGACDSLGGHRAQLLASLENAITYAQNLRHEKNTGQFNMFDEVEESIGLESPQLENVEEMPAHEKLAYEKELLGFYFSGHPLLRYRLEIDALSTHSVSELGNCPQDNPVRIAGLLTSVERRQTKNGKTMGRGRLEDLTGETGLVIFPKTFANLVDTLVLDTAVLVTAKVQHRGDSVELVVDNIQPLEAVSSQMIQAVEVHVTEGGPSSLLMEFEELLQRQQGARAKLRVIFETADKDKYVLASGRQRVSTDQDFLKDLVSLFGENNIRYFARSY